MCGHPFQDLRLFFKSFFFVILKTFPVKIGYSVILSINYNILDSLLIAWNWIPPPLSVNNKGFFQQPKNGVIWNGKRKPPFLFQFRKLLSFPHFSQSYKARALKLDPISCQDQWNSTMANSQDAVCKYGSLNFKMSLVSCKLICWKERQWKSLSRNSKIIPWRQVKSAKQEKRGCAV